MAVHYCITFGLIRWRKGPKKNEEKTDIITTIILIMITIITIRNIAIITIVSIVITIVTLITTTITIQYSHCCCYYYVVALSGWLLVSSAMPCGVRCPSQGQLVGNNNKNDNHHNNNNR